MNNFYTKFGNMKTSMFMEPVNLTRQCSSECVSENVVQVWSG